MSKWYRFWKAFDLARIFPRAVMVGCAFMTWEVTQWFMSLSDPTNAQGLFVSVVYGVIPLLLNFYMQNGVPWSQQATTTITATSTTKDKP